MSNTAPSRADPVVVFPLSQWCPPQETSQPHPPPYSQEGNKHIAGNYRRFSLTSMVYMLLELFVRDALIEYMKVNNLTSRKQFGFLFGRSTVLQLLRVLDQWTAILDRGGCVNVIYCDLMKAFETVPHHRLICVLQNYGFDDLALSWAEDFLTD